jgi:hypothetical protein
MLELPYNIAPGGGQVKSPRSSAAVRGSTLLTVVLPGGG